MSKTIPIVKKISRALLAVLFFTVTGRAMGAQENPLQYAAATGNLNLIKSLVADGVPIDGTDDDGDTAMHCAACDGHGKIVAYLHRSGAQLNPKNNDDETPLMYVAQTGYFPVIKYLIEHAGRATTLSEILVARNYAKKANNQKVLSYLTMVATIKQLESNLISIDDFAKKYFILSYPRKTTENWRTALRLAKKIGSPKVISILYLWGMNACAQLFRSTQFKDKFFELDTAQKRIFFKELRAKYLSTQHAYFEWDIYKNIIETLPAHLFFLLFDQEIRPAVVDYFEKMPHHQYITNTIERLAYTDCLPYLSNNDRAKLGTAYSGLIKKKTELTEIERATQVNLSIIQYGKTPDVWDN